MGMPTEDIVLTEVGKNGQVVKSVTLLGSREHLTWTQNATALTISKPDLSGCMVLPVFKIKWKWTSDRINASMVCLASHLFT